MFVLLPILFFLSGLTALIYQMVWMRELVLVFGASMFAISTLLTAFMGGLALGSWFFGKRAARFKNPLKTYAFLELGIGIYALLVPFFFSALLPVYQSLYQIFDFSFYAFSLVRFVFAVCILLVPTALMGGTLPVLAERYKNTQSVGKGVGLLYAFNTFGAVLGVLSAGFFLLPAIGLQKTTLLSAALNLLIALLAFSLGKADKSDAAPVAEIVKKLIKTKKSVKEARQTRALQPVLFTVFAVSGFSAMIYEVVWTRVLTLILGSTVYSYATMLSTYLLGLAIGSFIFSHLLKRFSRPLLLLTLVQAGIALFAFAGEFLFPLLPTVFLKIMGVLHTWSKVRAVTKFVIAGSVMMIPTLLMGGIFPLVIHILTSKKTPKDKSLGAVVGRAYAVNTLGTIFGSFSVGFILLPTFGIQKSLHLAIMINALLALLLWLTVVKKENSSSPILAKSTPWATAGVFSFLFLMLFTAPPWNPLNMSSELFGQRAKIDLLYYEEGISATVTVVQHQTLAKDAHLTLAIDGKPNASTTGDMKTQLLVAHLPLLFADTAKNVMSIGHGSGITTGSMITHPISKLVTLELEPAVIEGSRFFDPFSHNVLDDARVSLVEDDARNYLLRTNEKYDVIVSEPSHPWRSGSAKLFTQEFFKLGKEHLNPGGVFSQWIHFYGIRSSELKTVIKTFHTVFAQVMIFYTDAGDLIMLGSETPFKINRDEITRKMSEPEVAKDLSRADIFSIYDLWAHFILGPNEIDRFVGDARLNTDDFTLVEFQTPKSLFEDTMSIHLAEMRGASSSAGNYLFPPDASDLEKAADYYKIGKSLIKMGKRKEAGLLIRDGLRLAPSATGKWLLGVLAYESDDRPGAERHWQTALQDDPRHEASLLSLAKFYQSQGAFKKATPFLEKLDQDTMTALSATYYKGVSLYFQGKYKEALEFLNRGTIFSAPFSYYYQHLVYEKLGRAEDAKRALGEYIVALNTLRKTLELKPKQFQDLPYWKDVKWRRKVGVQIPEEQRMALLFERIVADPLGDLYGGAGLYLLGRYEDALILLEKGVKELGRHAEGSMIYYYLGLTYKELGHIRESQEAFTAFAKKSTLAKTDIRLIVAKRQAAILIPPTIQ